MILKEKITPSAIGNACKRKSLCNNYQWRYNDNKLNIEKYESKLFNNKKVLQYDTKGNYIASFDSITLAKEKTGATKIGMVCCGKRKTSGGYVWKFK